MNIEEININDVKYPALLRKIHNPPKRIYCYGNLELLKERKIAVVGSRKTSSYGDWVAYKLAQTLALHKVTVVSGLAMGIDAKAHWGALDKEGGTIAVLGCGMDIHYPVANDRLRKIIEQKGLIISEYKMGTKGSKFTFPMRNRIISGLSEATVIAEAGINSGSLITANYTVEQGKDVYVIPSNINNGYNMGGNLLIRDGAIPLVILDDIISHMGIKSLDIKEKKISLGRDEKAIYTLLLNEGEVSIDYISNKLHLPVSKVGGIITILEMKGILYTALGKIFLAK